MHPGYPNREANSKRGTLVCDGAFEHQGILTWLQKWKASQQSMANEHW